MGWNTYILFENCLQLVELKIHKYVVYFFKQDQLALMVNMHDNLICLGISKEIK